MQLQKVSGFAGNFCTDKDQSSSQSAYDNIVCSITKHEWQGGKYL